MKKQSSAGNHKSVLHLVRQRGASLLEGIAFLGIAAIVILGAVSLLSSAFSSAQGNRSMEELISIRTAVKKLYAGSGGYGTGSLLDALYATKSLPANLATTVGTGGVVTATNSWGGDVAVTGATGQFQIVYNSVPNDVCIALITGGHGWNSVKIDTGTAITTFPISLSSAATACELTGNSRTITWMAS